MANDKEPEDTMRHDLHLLLLRLRRHLRSCNTSTRALRDAARVMAVDSLTGLPFRSRLCRPSLCRLAA
jgi:PleD family two-component response regulator